MGFLALGAQALSVDQRQQRRSTLHQDSQSLRFLPSVPGMNLSTSCKQEADPMELTSLQAGGCLQTALGCLIRNTFQKLLVL